MAKKQSKANEIKFLLTEKKIHEFAIIDSDGKVKILPDADVTVKLFWDTIQERGAGILAELEDRIKGLEEENARLKEELKETSLRYCDSQTTINDSEDELKLLENKND